jgi:hypothetical protein
MGGKIPPPPAAAPRIATTSLAELPLVAQNDLAFGAIVTALGFAVRAIGHRVSIARSIGTAAEPVVYATLSAEGREFLFALGVAVPDMDRGSRAPPSCGHVSIRPHMTRSTIDACSSIAMASRNGRWSTGGRPPPGLGGRPPRPPSSPPS